MLVNAEKPRTKFRTRVQTKQMIAPSRKTDSAPIGFTFFSNHAHVLLLIARESDVRMRELAAEVGITERAVQRIIDDLTANGYVTVTKEGRRNLYQIQGDLPLRHPIERHCTIGSLIGLVFP
ncbi:helix-turn-helix transcriptional regulator [Acidicapsa ligni]|uniref:helix-turn-helix transcriptional regulator n=1 Tax=Acidicapsa ligni TaxID=542300 RepID=UPI0021E0F159|nr:winged helix-turn-helix domain-containing protein [Acidicapsa ligni]